MNHPKRCFQLSVSLTLLVLLGISFAITPNSMVTTAAGLALRNQKVRAVSSSDQLPHNGQTMAGQWIQHPAANTLTTSGNPLTPTMGQWTQTNGPYGGSITALLVNGTNLFAGTEGGGIFLSTNNGQNWTAVNNGLTNQNVRALAVSGNNLFAGTVGDGVFLSTNNGESWAAANNGLTNLTINSLAASDKNIFAGTEGAGVFRGSDFISSASSVSAASYAGTTLATESIAATFGAGLANATQSANTLPLPTVLAGTTIRVKDVTGSERLAPLFFVSPGQINFQIPAGTAVGAATATVKSGDGVVSLSPLQIGLIAPGLFTANATGEGVPAAVVVRVKANNFQSFEPVARFDSTQNKFVPVPIDLGPASDQVFLILNGTGIRYRSSLSAVTVTLGGLDAQVSYAGPQNDFVGLDQINVRVPRELAGRGDVFVNLKADGIAANMVLVNIK